MKVYRPIFLSCLFLLVAGELLLAQENACQNLNFEMGDFTNWEAYGWQVSEWRPEINTEPAEGFLDRRHTIISDTNAYDPKTGYALKMVPSGFKYCARLGDMKRDGDSSPRCWHQSLRYHIDVDEFNALLILKFALVLQYDYDHTPEQEPRFSLTLFEENGDTLDDCANYDVFATNEYVKGFQTYVVGDDEEVRWRDWTTVGVDLTQYIGKSVSVEFMARDCTWGLDYGYAYFVAYCRPLNIALTYCADDTIPVLGAPEGFERYKWTDTYGTIIDTVQTLFLKNPVEGATYTCEMTSATGCDVSVYSVLHKYNPVADFSHYMLDCFSNIVQLTNLSTTNQGSTLYYWDFGDGNISTENSPSYKFETSGMHEVTLTFYNPPSTCVDILTKDVESFSPPLVYIGGDSTYCPGETTEIYGIGAYRYEWMNGAVGDTHEIGAPGGEFWMVGHSSTGCHDTNRITVIEEPYWEFSYGGDTILCDIDTVSIFAEGAFEYLWNTGDTTNEIIVSDSGSYKVIGTNINGCEKEGDFHIIRRPLPYVGFELSSYALNRKESELSGTILNEPGTQYNWDLGDGNTATGSEFNHSYEISSLLLSYDISLSAIDMYGCENDSTDLIDIIPFVPNVFSPNGDGVNDLFMPGIEIEIIDRNGISIYQGNEGWDGKYKGEPVSQDTYFYFLTYFSERAQHNNHKKGYLTLVR
ncbi:MAG: gliding motility-associated C-terminal domain-containing protein [Bacteroidales bacterium]|nr:gliding motility-associated C-terminal domain-containing protein [Bacteroidales bacterium]MBN2819581.1 gliding motility-associated C-terminal domain-containing protein [Bacteroidales bacterium]